MEHSFFESEHFFLGFLPLDQNIHSISISGFLSLELISLWNHLNLTLLHHKRDTRVFTSARFFTGWVFFELILMYLEAVGKGFFTKLNIELSICLQKMTPKSVKNAMFSTMNREIKKNVGSKFWNFLISLLIVEIMAF